MDSENQPHVFRQSEARVVMTDHVQLSSDRIFSPMKLKRVWDLGTVSQKYGENLIE